MNVYFKSSEESPEQLILKGATVTEVQELKSEFLSGGVWSDAWSDTIECVDFSYGIDEQGNLYALFTAMA